MGSQTASGEKGVTLSKQLALTPPAVGSRAARRDDSAAVRTRGRISLLRVFLGRQR